jgi:hypothetical protein
VSIKTEQEYNSVVRERDWWIEKAMSTMVELSKLEKEILDGVTAYWVAGSKETVWISPETMAKIRHVHGKGKFH